MERNKWPNWSIVYELWKTFDVPPLKVVPFEIGKHFNKLAWLELESGIQANLMGNPLKNTGYHLAIYLKEKDEELVAAYKIYAFCKQNDINTLPTYTISDGFKKFKERLYGWWHPNAKYVIPPTKTINDYDLYKWRNDSKKWKEVIRCAAIEWKSVAKEWALIVIPDFRDPSSEEYQGYQEYCEKLYQKHEYEEYLRLKKNFEEQKS